MTLLFITFAVMTGFLALCLFFFQATRKTYPGFGSWTAGVAVISAGYLLFSLRGIVPLWITIFSANLSFPIGLLLQLDGMRLFLGLPTRRWPYFTVSALLVLALAIFTFHWDSVYWRGVVTSVPMIAIEWYMAVLLFRSDASPRSTFIRVIGSLLVLGGCTSVTRNVWFALPWTTSLIWTAESEFVFWLGFVVVHLGEGLSFMMLNAERLEREQQETSEEFRTTLYSIGDGVITTDTRGFVKQMNPVAERLTGWLEAEAKGKYLVEIFHIINEESREVLESAAKKVLQHGHVVGLANHTVLISRDGSEHPIADSGAPISNEKGVVVGVVLVFRDQTEERVAEKKLRESEDLYRAVFDNAGIGIDLVDREGLIVRVNRAFADMLGYTESDLSRIPLAEITHPDDRELSSRYIKSLRSGEINSFDLKKRYISKDGTTIWGDLHVTAIRDAEGTFIHGLGVIADISDRKRAEEALRESQERFRLAFDNANIGVCLVDPEGRLLRVNKKMTEMFGYTESELESMIVNSFTYPEDLDLSPKFISQALSGEVDKTEFEKRYIHKDGHIVTARVVSSLVKDSQGKPLYFISHIQDITDRKRAEQALRESEERYRTVADYNYDWETWYSVENELLYVSPSCERITGYCAEEFLLNPKLMNEILHPDDRSEILNHFHTARKVDYDKSYALDFRIINRNGQTRWIAHVCQPVWSREGQPMGRRASNRDITNRKKAQADLAQSEARYHDLADVTFEGIMFHQEGVLLEANDQFFQMFGYDRDELLGTNILEKTLAPESREIVRSYIQSGGTEPREYVGLRKDGTTFSVEVRIRQTAIEGKHVRSVAIRDITDRKLAEQEKEKLQTQLLHSQKMEAVGTLAAGIAHDFNNLLQVVMGYSDMLVSRKREDEPDYHELRKIHAAGERGADLVRNLLMFSSRVQPKLRPMLLNDEIVQVQKFLSRTIPKTITLNLRLAADLEVVLADTSQMGQVLMNLGVNARDAMPDGGTLTIETTNRELDEDYCAINPGANPGRYVCLNVADTGHGMDRQTLSHIFDPFFTTKETGKGTGLGLSTVYGIIKQHNGYITCYSEPGVGTTFKIYLPAIGSKTEEEVRKTETVIRGGNETILLVDDEEYVRDLGAAILTPMGYNVLTAGDGKEALEIYQKEGKRISLVILDLIMPGMDGKHCLAEMLKRDPHARVLIASGYSQNGPVPQAELVGARGFIEKPYDTRKLLQLVREVLDGD